MNYDSNEEINAKENQGSNVNDEEKIIPINSNSQSLNNENFRSSENKSSEIKASLKSENESGKSSDEVKNSVKNEDEGEKRKEREEEENGNECENGEINTQIENKKSNELDLTSALLRMDKDIKFLSNIIEEKGNAFIKELKNNNEILKKIAEILSEKKISN